ncbi:MAG: DUF5399 family protein [Chlamydiia bacterium]|nr:DUF5399 family protein [Chlamydiia bacterium]
MTTIDQLDIRIYIQYAKRSAQVEQIQRDFRLNEATSVPAQTQLVDLYPKLTELELLLGVSPFLRKPWAHFHAPEHFDVQRWSPFAFGQVAPLLGSQEVQTKIREKLKKLTSENKKNKKRRKAILDCLDEVEDLNDLIGFIVGRMGQFLQG